VIFEGSKHASPAVPTEYKFNHCLDDWNNATKLKETLFDPYTCSKKENIRNNTKILDVAVVV
jgi:hypothetical protein